MERFDHNSWIIKAAKEILREKNDILSRLLRLKNLGLDLQEIIDLAFIVADEDEKETV